ncbi:MAG: hypothetical protein KJ065_14360 [Anaerolineae bacterium]|nr:hypothetical protein [Anaerolineae bacterium]
MNLRRISVLLLALLAVAQGVNAQGAQGIAGDIAYGLSVNGTITDDAMFQLWRFEARAGDNIRAGMQASGGLAPLIGILDSGGDLVAASPDGEVDAGVTVSYTIPADDIYTLVATRVGRDQGTTTGSYVLSLALVNPSAPGPNAREVTFRCGTAEIASALKIVLDSSLVVEGVNYRIDVYGLDGFQTTVHITSDLEITNYCRRGNDHTGGDYVALPGETPVIIDQAMQANTFELEIDQPELLGDVNIVIGSEDAAAGRYLAVVTGLSIDAPGEQDVIQFEVGPLAAQADVLVYAVAVDAANSRLDPYVRLYPNDTGCDDAGRRGCEDVPSIAGAGLRLADEFSLLGDRFDAGVRLQRDDLERQFVEIGSFSGNTSGEYALVIIGTLPPRT